MKAGIEMVRTFSSFVLSMIAPNTPVCVKHGRIAAERILELPFVATSKIARGTSAQCIPNITKTCHRIPSTRPKTIGLKFMIAWKRLVNPSEKALAIGPTTKNVNGTVMSNVKKGTTKTLMTSGVILVKNF